MDEDKVAAAILAAEASRQKEALIPSNGGKDIPGELLKYYEHFLGKISKKHED